MVAATLIAVNASEFFTQDIEDLDYGEVVDSEIVQERTRNRPPAPPRQPQQDSRAKTSPQAQAERGRPERDNGNGDGLDWRSKLAAMKKPTLGNVANHATLMGAYNTNDKGDFSHALNAISEYPEFPDGWEGDSDTVVKPENAVKIFDWLLKRKK